MSRPLRVEMAGGVYHVTSRGDGCEDIFLEDDDRRQFLAVLYHETECNPGSTVYGSGDERHCIWI